VEEYQLIRKWLAVGIILLFVGIAYAPATAQNIKKHLPLLNKNIIYVDDDNIKGPWDGSFSYPYLTIKEGLKAAENLTTIFVLNGNYTEVGLDINKRVRLVGEDRNRTIIRDANAAALNIYADFVRIENFKFMKNGYYQNPDGAIEIYSDFCLIKNNNFKDNVQQGIFLYGCFNHIVNNVFDGNHDGIILDRSSRNLINKNTFRNNKKGYGIKLEDYSRKNIILSNNFIDNGENAVFQFSRTNIWIKNYWSDLEILKIKIIEGKILIRYGILPDQTKIVKWYNFDWSPAKEPYNIPGMR
jgi:parallel beta-helix repeat protein